MLMRRQQMRDIAIADEKAVKSEKKFITDVTFIKILSVIYFLL